MKRIGMAFVFIAMIGIYGAALADTVPVSGTHSESEITAACGKAKGGVPFTDDNGTYGCRADGGSIKCTNGKCVGACDNCGSPTISRGKSPVLGVLSGTTLKAGPGSVAKSTPQTPTHKGMLVEQKDSGEMHKDETEHGKRK